MSRGRHTTPRRKAPKKGRQKSKRTAAKTAKTTQQFALFALFFAGLGVVADALQVREAIKEEPSAPPDVMNVLVEQPTERAAIREALTNHPGTISRGARRGFVVTLQRKRRKRP